MKRSLFVPAFVLASFGVGCGSSSSPPAPKTGSIVLAVMRGPELQSAPVKKLNLNFFVPGGLKIDDEVQLAAEGFFGRPVQASVDAKDVDGDGNLEATVEFTGDPFQGPEVSMQFRGTVTRPMRIRAQAFDADGLLAEGTVDKDTKGMNIVFTVGTEPIVEIKLQCSKSGGCSVDGGTTDDGDQPTSTTDASND